MWVFFDLSYFDLTLFQNLYQSHQSPTNPFEI